MSRKIFVCLILAALIITIATGCWNSKTSDIENGKTENLEISFKAEELFSGETVNFPVDFSGDVVYLNFFFYG